MVLPRDVIKVVVAVVALNASLMHCADAFTSAAMATCTMTVSPGDAAVGIQIVTDTGCVSGGVGCIDDACRFCKVRDTPQSSHMIACPSSDPASPSTEATIPQAGTRAQDTAATTPSPTACTVSDGDKAVGVQAVEDATCAIGGLGCYNADCRFCKAWDTPQSSHMLACSSFGKTFLTPTSTVPTPVGTDPCDVSSGDFAAGIRAVTDATCVYGGLGCYNDHCRFCKATSTPQSSHLTDCSAFTTTTTPAAAEPLPLAANTPADAPSGLTPPASPVPSVDNVGDKSASPSPLQPTDNVADTSSPTTADAGVPSSPAPQTSSGEIPTQNVASSTCESNQLSKGDAAVGLALVHDPDRCPGGGVVGCLPDRSPCRFCKKFESEQSHDYDYCPGSEPTPAILVQAAADKSEKGGLAAEIGKMFKDGSSSAIAMAAAACVGMIATVVVVVLAAKRVTRRLRSSSINSCDEDEADAAVTEDSATPSGGVADDGAAVSIEV